MGLCSLNLKFITAGERITFGGAVDRAAVDHAVDLAASFVFWGPGAQGPNWPLGTQEPHPKSHEPLLPKPHILYC